MKSLAAAGLIAVSMLAVPEESLAGINIGIRIDRGSRYYDSGRVAYNRGYEDGYREGEKDGRHGDRFGFWDEGRYRGGDHGYRRNYGPRWEYTNSYRRGFESGYRRAYESYNRYQYYGRDRYRDSYDRRDWYDSRDRDRDGRYDDRYERDRYRR